MDTFDSDPTKIIPVPDIFRNEPDIRTPYLLEEPTKLAIAQFLEAYNLNPSQYDNKKPTDLLHPGWVQNHSTSLSIAARMGSIQLYQFIIDTGAVGQISNRQFLEDCFYQGEVFSYAFTKYLFDICPNRINLIPPNIIFYFLVRPQNNISLHCLQLFFDYCPQLCNPDFLNSKIRIPSKNIPRGKLLNSIANCITDGGYNDDNLLSLELEEQDQFTLDDREDFYILNYLISKIKSITILRSFITNTNISLAPLYRNINPVSDNQDGLRLLKNTFGSIQQIFSTILLESSVFPSIENAMWYLKWWKTDILGEVVSIDKFKTFILNLITKPDSRYKYLSLPFIEYLGDDFFNTLSSDLIFNFLTAILNNICPMDPTSIVGSYDPFPLINTILSFPSIANTIKDHCIHFTRAFLLRLCSWDCAELFLKLGGLTMEHIWSKHDYDDNNDKNENVFTLKTLIASPCLQDNVLPGDLVNWLSYQPGTQEQLIKLVKSKDPLTPNKWIDVPQPLRQLFFFLSSSYHQEHKRQLQRRHSQLPQRFLQQLNPPPSSMPQSLSWLQSFIVHFPIDYINVKFTTKQWGNLGSFLSFGYMSVRKDNLIGLPHLSIIMDELYTYDSPVFLLEDIIQGVIASLLINHQENDRQQ